MGQGDMNTYIYTSRTKNVEKGTRTKRDGHNDADSCRNLVKR